MMNRLLSLPSFFLAALLISAVAGRSVLAEGKRVALVVGVEHYDPDLFSPLRFAEDDALALEKVLTEIEFDVISMTAAATIPARKPNTPGKILDQLDRRLRNRDSDDTVLIFLSGHGIQLKSDPIAEDGSRETYFCPEEADPADKTTLLPLSVLMDKLAQCGAQRKVLLIDACRNEMVPRNSKKGFTELPPVQVERPPVPKGMLALFSCSPKETSHEFEELGHGVFTNFLLDYLGGNAQAARYPRDEFRVTELAAYVSRETGDYLDRKLGKSQSPQLICPGGLSDWPLGKRLAAEPAMLVAPFSRSAAEAAQAGWAKKLRSPVLQTNSIGMKLTLVPAGEFQMGSTAAELDAVARIDSAFDPEYSEDEQPPHRVTVTRPYYLGQMEVTRGQFGEFVRDEKFKTEAERDGRGGIGIDGDSWIEKPEYTWRNPGFPQTDEHPVLNVSWNDAVAFCVWLSRKEGKRYRLPTEAEWEYACRAGTTTRYHHGDDPEGLAGVANLADGTAKRKFARWHGTIAAEDGYVFTAPGGRFRANNFGLFDLHGNVFEWCSDRYEIEYYGEAPGRDPLGPSEGSLRVIRGGGWRSIVWHCRSADRREGDPWFRSYELGFRVVQSPSGDK